jgi:hypothetical protein
MNASIADRRWQREVAELADLVPRAEGKLRFVTTDDGLRLELDVRSPCVTEGSEPRIDVHTHVVNVVRPPDWPGRPLQLYHQSPVGVWHPNIFRAAADESPAGRLLAGLGLLPDGAVCYSDRASPEWRLSHVVEQLWDLLGFRNGRYSTSLDDCLSPRAVRWANRVQSEQPGLLPTERRPLVERRSGEQAGEGA